LIKIKQSLSSGAAFFMQLLRKVLDYFCLSLVKWENKLQNFIPTPEANSLNYTMYLSAILIVACCCLLAMSYLSWKRREIPVAISYGLGMLAGAFYSFGYAFEIISLLRSKYFLASD
jgi:mannose/fructose/N-acetylgalactosamine-specific phosphotransferase system component IIC